MHFNQRQEEVTHLYLASLIPHLTPHEKWMKHIILFLRFDNLYNIVNHTQYQIIKYNSGPLKKKTVGLH